MIGPVMRRVLRYSAYCCSLLLFLTMIISAFGGRINPNIFALPSSIFLIFPYIVILSVATVGVWAFTRHKWMAIVGGVALILSWGSIHTTLLPMHFAKEAQAGDTTFSVLTFNLWSGGDANNPQNPNSPSIDFILESGADIVCIQEFYDFGKLPPASRERYLSKLKSIYPYMVTEGTNCDLAAFSKFPMKRLDINKDPDFIHNYEAYSVDVDGTTLSVVNLHMQSYHFNEHEQHVISQMRSPKKVQESIDEMKLSILGKLHRAFMSRSENASLVADLVKELPSPAIVCGDFNDVPGSWAWRTLTNAGLDDAYNATNFLITPTYHRHAFYFKIDHILYSKDSQLTPLYVDKCSSVKSSDHYPLLAVFALKTRR